MSWWKQEEEEATLCLECGRLMTYQRTVEAINQQDRLVVVSAVYNCRCGHVHAYVVSWVPLNGRRK